MDPDKVLEDLRRAIADYCEAEQLEDEQQMLRSSDQIVEHFQVLDEWLTKGGFLPDPWENWKS